MWEFFLGISIACFFAVYFLKKSGNPPKKPYEVLYAPRDEVIKYTTHRKTGVNAPEPSFSFNAPGAVSAKAQAPLHPFQKDDFVEYAASVAAESHFSEMKNASDDAENDEKDDKKSKFGALRFFNS